MLALSHSQTLFLSLTSLCCAGISLHLAIPNSFIPHFASNRSAALSFVSAHLLPFLPRTPIHSLSLGADPLSSDLAPFLLPALYNLQAALSHTSLTHIKVSTTLSFSHISSPFPPSSAKFHKSISEIQPLLDFLSLNGAPLFVNLYPFSLYLDDPTIPLGFALFREEPFSYRSDPITGIRYRNLFDAMVDAFGCAMVKAGQDSIPIAVAETGWPTQGANSDAKAEASLRNAGFYNKGLLRSMREKGRRKVKVEEAYIFSLFDENMRPGPEMVSHWGWLYPNMTMKYDLDFFASGACRLRRGAFWSFSIVGLLLVVAVAVAVVVLNG
ncbi:glucan endo-1,3-beta-glucosidase 13 [Amborella trichopoda]|uniref:Glucan endo-1,3-beta-D-glucosidase n=1 Tax=Amborella trichopoda TaxID=13333 RepID=U5CUT5_AMBTC|nr:glucan endo-1,3-beta-glucosidase 13 [Amborella trichopoda]ERM96799.1 hypothetical protein AMTR_s03830p00001040 [Amborella trichopoda]|eukprot:XP_006829383.3 glucan endo-1,3-beta-glucosidase 13 [Amborella trichopoda]